MHLRILDKGVIHRRGTLAEQNMVRTGGETRYPRVTEPAHRGETEQVPVEGLCLLQIVDRNGPVRDAFNMQETQWHPPSVDRGAPSGACSSPSAACTWSSTRPS